MTRTDVGPASQVALTDDTCRILPLVHLDIKDDNIYVWGGTRDLEWGGNTFKGVGTLGEIGNIQSDIKGGISSVDIAINGIDPDLLHDAKGTFYRGRSGSIWLGIFDQKWDLVEDPGLFVSGEMAAMSLIDNKKTGRVGITIDSRQALLRKNRTTLRTDEEHQRRHPGDKFFSFVSKVRNKTIYWGLQASRGATAVGGGSQIQQIRSEPF